MALCLFLSVGGADLDLNFAFLKLHTIHEHEPKLAMTAIIWVTG